VKLSLLRYRFALFVVAVVAAAVSLVGLISSSADAGSTGVGEASSLTNPAAIQKLAAKAYVWASAPEFV
jgi:hypothetical protein